MEKGEKQTIPQATQATKPLKTTGFNFGNFEYQWGFAWGEVEGDRKLNLGYLEIYWLILKHVLGFSVNILGTEVLVGAIFLALRNPGQPDAFSSK